MANVITHGMFDLFHVGHLRLLQRSWLWPLPYSSGWWSLPGLTPRTSAHGSSRSWRITER